MLCTEKAALSRAKPKSNDLWVYIYVRRAGRRPLRNACRYRPAGTRAVVAFFPTAVIGGGEKKSSYNNKNNNNDNK